VVRAEAHVFVEVEAGAARKIEALLAVHADQFAIEQDRGAVGGEAEDGSRLFPDERGEEARGFAGAAAGSGVMMIAKMLFSRGVW